MRVLASLLLRHSALYLMYDFNDRLNLINLIIEVMKVRRLFKLAALIRKRNARGRAQSKKKQRIYG